MKAVPDQIGRFVSSPFIPLGTDGYGRSDTRVALRRHFEVDAPSIAVAVLDGLAQQDRLPRHVVAEAIEHHGNDTEVAGPRSR
jgi:pyruvate dehydrogenase E1 component